jgi:hypothetical protein
MESVWAVGYAVSAQATLAGDSLSISYVGCLLPGWGRKSFSAGLALYASQFFTARALLWLCAAEAYSVG